MSSFDESSVAGLIDHTVLKQQTSLADIEKLCGEARDFKFASVCVPPYWVRRSRELLEGAEAKVATVIGFPFGYCVYPAKVTEIQEAVRDGAHEVDVVANVAAIKAHDWAHLEAEIAAVMQEVRKHEGLVCKVIIESGILSDEEVIRCCEIYGAAGIDFLKTSTGFAEKGASVHAVSLFRAHLPASVQIKASGGIRTLAEARAMRVAGATRLGCSAGVQIVREETEKVAAAPVAHSAY